MLVPAIMSTGIWCCSNHCRTPISLSARAEPPARARPMRGRVVGPGGGADGAIEAAEAAELDADLLAPPCSPFSPAAGVVEAGAPPCLGTWVEGTAGPEGVCPFDCA